MKNILLFVFCLLVITAHSQQWLWAKNISYTSTYPYRSCLAADNNANFYVASEFNTGAPCFAKFDSQGNELWRQYVMYGDIKGITCSANYVYITGSFYDTLKIGSNKFLGAGVSDIYVACFSSNGNFLWANTYGGSNNDYGSGISSDLNGNLYVIGKYSGTAKFGQSTFVCHGSGYNMFMVKLNSSGNILLLKSAGTLDTTSYGSEGSQINTDISGNIFITGRFSDILLDTFHLVGYGSYFLARLDPLGNTQWIKATGDDYHPTNDFIFDSYGNVLLTGEDDWNHGSNARTFKYNSVGQLKWDSVIGCGYWGGWGLNGIAADGRNSFATGAAGCLDYGSNGSYVRTYFLFAEYDSIGALILLDTIASDAFGERIIRDSNGDYVITGVMDGKLKLGNDSLSVNVRQRFIAKFKGSNSTAITENTDLSEKNNIYPNPSTGVFTVEVEKDVESAVNVFDVFGKSILHKCMDNKSSATIDLTGVPKGIYLMEIQSAKTRIVRKIVLE